MLNKTYTSFGEFYPLYLSEHQHPTCRRFYVTGSALVILTLIYAEGQLPGED